jgi:hypothetical protein
MSTVVANWAGVSNFLFCSALCGMLVSGLYVSKAECSFQNFRLQINHNCCDLRFFRALKLVSRYTCHDLDTHGSHFVHTCLMCEATAGIKRLLFFPRRTTVNCWVFSSGQQAFMYILGWSLQKARFCFRPKLSAETHLKTFILSGPLYFLYIKGASLAGLRGCPRRQKNIPPVRSSIYGCRSCEVGSSGSFGTMLPLQTASIVTSGSGLEA